MTHPNQPPFTEHERVKAALIRCAYQAMDINDPNPALALTWQLLSFSITPEGARKLVALLRL